MRLVPVYRITVFVPPAHLEGLQRGICAIDSLRQGDYEQGMWISAPGLEQFRPLPGAQPSQGQVGELEQVETVRLELCIPRDPARLQRLIEQGIRPHHPWDVPAIFVDESSFALP